MDIFLCYGLLSIFSTFEIVRELEFPIEPRFEGVRSKYKRFMPMWVKDRHMAFNKTSGQGKAERIKHFHNLPDIFKQSTSRPFVGYHVYNAHTEARENHNHDSGHTHKRANVLFPM